VGERETPMSEQSKRAEWEDRQMALIYKAEGGKVGPEAFDLKNADERDLLWTIEHIWKRPESTGLEQLREAISSELRRRRQR
jgi:hypothetical protein